MSLADYQPETRVIPFKGGSFAVRGLTLNDFTSLVRTHMPDLEAIFDLGSNVIGGKSDLDDGDLTKLIIAFTEQAPGLVANLICLTAGETDEKAVANASILPFPTQAKALFEIADMTFAEVGGIKNAVESVAGLLKKNPDALKAILTQHP